MLLGDTFSTQQLRQSLGICGKHQIYKVQHMLSQIIVEFPVHVHGMMKSLVV